MSHGCSRDSKKAIKDADITGYLNSKLGEFCGHEKGCETFADGLVGNSKRRSLLRMIEHPFRFFLHGIKSVIVVINFPLIDLRTYA